MVLPKWVPDLLETALKEYFGNESIRILEYTSSLAIPVGENYTTDIFRSSITYINGKRNEKDVISIIIKCCPPNELLSDYAKLMGLFEQEIGVYTQVLPAANDILCKNDLQRLSAKCIYYTNHPTSAIMLEDLSKLNFKVSPRQKGLDLQHCLAAVEKLAYFHASSAVLYEKEPSLINNYKKGIYWDNPFTQRWISTGFKALIEACGKWPGYEKYSAKLDNIKDKAIEKTLAASQRRLEDFNVLNHGDFWINNFMFSYDLEGKLEDCRLVDFQVVLHSSPTVDLNYFWATSPNIDVRNQHLDTVLDYYFTKLLTLLTKLEYPSVKIPSRAGFREDLHSRAFYGLSAAVTVLPLVAASTRNDANFEDLFSNDDQGGFRHDAYNNERYRKYMEYLLPFYDNLSILD